RPAPAALAGQRSLFGFTGAGPQPAPQKDLRGIVAPPSGDGRVGQAPKSVTAGSSPDQVTRAGGAIRSSQAQPPRPVPNTPPRSAPPSTRQFALGPGGPPATELKVVPLAEHLAGNLRPAMLTLLGVVGLV